MKFMDKEKILEREEMDKICGIFEEVLARGGVTGSDVFMKKFIKNFYLHMARKFKYTPKVKRNE